MSSASTQALEKKTDQSGLDTDTKTDTKINEKQAKIEEFKFEKTKFTDFCFIVGPYKDSKDKKTNDNTDNKHTYLYTNKIYLEKTNCKFLSELAASQQEFTLDCDVNAFKKILRYIDPYERSKLVINNNSKEYLKMLEYAIVFRYTNFQEYLFQCLSSISFGDVQEIKTLLSYLLTLTVIKKPDNNIIFQDSKDLLDSATPNGLTKYVYNINSYVTPVLHNFILNNTNKYHELCESVFELKNKEYNKIVENIPLNVSITSFSSKTIMLLNKNGCSHEHIIKVITARGINCTEDDDPVLQYHYVLFRTREQKIAKDLESTLQQTRGFSHASNSERQDYMRVIRENLQQIINYLK